MTPSPAAALTGVGVRQRRDEMKPPGDIVRVLTKTIASVVYSPSAAEQSAGHGIGA